MIKQNIIFVLILTFICTNSLAQEAINQFDEHGKRHGVWKKNFDKTKQPRYQGQFDHGKEIGVFKFYTLKNGKSVLSATKEFDAKNSIAKVKFFSSTGKLISEGSMNGKLYIGTWLYYHNKTEAIMTSETYNDVGELHGEKLVYYKTGQIAERANYAHGKIEGLSTWYSEKGTVLKEFLYENNELHGVSKYYDSEGELVAEGQYRNGMKHGIWKYYTNGKLTKETDFTIRSKNPKKQ